LNYALRNKIEICSANADKFAKYIEIGISSDIWLIFTHDIGYLFQNQYLFISNIHEYLSEYVDCILPRLFQHSIENRQEK
jgi:hypothetical protein